VNPSIRHLLGFFIHYGVFGLALLNIADDSFLFLPVGGDLLMVVLVARNHSQLPWCVLAAAIGSTIGVFVLDLVCRKGGEQGLKRLVKPGLHSYLKMQIERHASVALVVSCLAPPPFPFGAAIAVASALQYPKARLLTIVLLSRAVRFSLVGWSAIYFGRSILRIAGSSEFLWFVGAFTAICVIGSTISIVHWVQLGKQRNSPTAA
jgi:membrane protein YqaA with SNARE-associated domain